MIMMIMSTTTMIMITMMIVNMMEMMMVKIRDPVSIPKIAAPLFCAQIQITDGPSRPAGGRICHAMF